MTVIGSCDAPQSRRWPRLGNVVIKRFVKMTLAKHMIKVASSWFDAC